MKKRKKQIKKEVMRTKKNKKNNLVRKRSLVFLIVFVLGIFIAVGFLLIVLSSGFFIIEDDYYLKEGAVGIKGLFGSPNPSNKKLIEYGWDVPDAISVRDNIKGLARNPSALADG
ncbi:MAG: hypothetical protein ABIH37_02530 [archaeon]